MPAIAAIADALPPDERAFAIIEVQDADDELPVAAETRWVHRGDAAPGTADLLTAAVAELAIPDGGARLPDG